MNDKYRSVYAVKGVLDKMSRMKQQDILGVVGDAPNGVSVQDISKRLRLAPSMVDYTVKNLAHHKKVRLTYQAGEPLVTLG